MIPSFTTGKVTFKSISRKEWEKIKKSAIRKWHWERTENGIKPVADEEST
jgi:hypothetical protein